MTAASIDRIRTSYRRLSPHADHVTSVFYDRLFAARPETRALFSGDMNVQRKHFAAALAMVVRNLGMLDMLEQPLRDLGAAHARAGVRPEHYPAMCDAIIAALADTAGDGWTDELAADWRLLLEAVARHMLAGSPPGALPE
jgi:hemoglobin-like flavoprotein